MDVTPHTLGIDPGFTTGLALLNAEGEIIATWALTTEDDLQKVLNLHSHPGLKVVAEDGPKMGGHNRTHTQVVEGKIREIFPDATWVFPGQWKGDPASRVSRAEMRGLTQHEKDAACLATWYQRRKLGDGKDTQ